eukprot:scaffold60360_cov23-Tisochrysis_lutea.AAC.1
MEKEQAETVCFLRVHERMKGRWRGGTVCRMLHTSAEERSTRHERSQQKAQVNFGTCRHAHSALSMFKIMS